MLKSTAPTIPKKTILQEVEAIIDQHGFTITDSDPEKPWGAYFTFAETDVPEFLSAYYPDFDTSQLSPNQQHYPKFLLIAPEVRLSWQYHHRRSEIWRCEDGPFGIVISDTDQETPVQTMNPGDIVTITQGQRHRGVGFNNWGVVTEIWQHTHPDHPSEEADIIRLQDDFDRK